MPPKPPLPTTPQNILKFYIDELTDYEKGEVLDYDKIYFLGKNKKDKVDGEKQKGNIANPDKESGSKSDDKKEE